MKSSFIEAAGLFVVSLLNALVSLLALRSDQGVALFFAILSAGFGFCAFWVIFADIRRTAKLFENQSVEPK